MSTQPRIDSGTPDFEESLVELAQIVRDLEDGSLGLEASLGRFERGIGLLRECYRVLEQAEQKIEILCGLDADGTPRVKPFDASATAEPTAAAPAGRRRAKKKTETPVEEPRLEESADDDGSLF